MHPKVTVCIPTYNRSALLADAISSVLSQTYEDFTLLICDNASTDGTDKVVASFCDARIQYHRHADNIGMLGNYRFALTHPRTEFVAYLSDDDLYAPTLLATAVDALQQWKDAAYFACVGAYFGGMSHGSLRPRSIDDTETDLIYSPPSHAARFLGTDTPGPMVVSRRSAFEQNIVWPRPDFLPVDLFLLTQLMAQGGFLFCNQPLYHFRVHTDNTSMVTDRKRRLRFNAMCWHGIRWLIRFLLERGVNSLEEIESHGRNSKNWEHHVVPLVLALASYDSPPEWLAMTRRIFTARKDVDAHSARFRLARRFGFWTMPLAEKLTQRYVGWKP